MHNAAHIVDYGERYRAIKGELNNTFRRQWSGFQIAAADPDDNSSFFLPVTATPAAPLPFWNARQLARPTLLATD